MKDEHLTRVELPRVTFLREGVMQRNVPGHAHTLAKLAAVTALGANRRRHVRDVVVRRADHQHGARLAVRVHVGLRLPPRLGHRPRPIRPRHLPDRSHLFELRESARGMLPQGFDRLPVRHRGLTLYLRERDTPQP